MGTEFPGLRALGGFETLIPAKSAQSSSSSSSSARAALPGMRQMSNTGAGRGSGHGGGRMCPAELERGQGCCQQLLGGASAAFGALQRAQRVQGSCPVPGGGGSGAAPSQRSSAAPAGSGQCPGAWDSSVLAVCSASKAPRVREEEPAGVWSRWSRVAACRAQAALLAAGEHKARVPPGGFCGCSIPHFPKDAESPLPGGCSIPFPEESSQSSP